MNIREYYEQEYSNKFNKYTDNKYGNPYVYGGFEILNKYNIVESSTEQYGDYKKFKITIAGDYAGKMYTEDYYDLLDLFWICKITSTVEGYTYEWSFEY